MFLDEGKRGNSIAFLPHRNGHHPGRAIGPITSLSFVGFLVVGPASTNGPHVAILSPLAPNRTARTPSTVPRALRPGRRSQASERKALRSGTDGPLRFKAHPHQVKRSTACQPAARHACRWPSLASAPRAQHVTSPASASRLHLGRPLRDRTGGRWCPVGTTARGWRVGPGDATRER